MSPNFFFPMKKPPLLMYSHKIDFSQIVVLY